MKLHENKESMELLISNISDRTGVRKGLLEKDNLDIEQIQETLNMLHFIFSDLVTA